MNFPVPDVSARSLRGTGEGKKKKKKKLKLILWKYTVARTGRLIVEISLE